MAILVYGVPLAALIASVVLIDALGLISPLGSLCVIVAALVCACGLVIGNGNIVHGSAQGEIRPEVPLKVIKHPPFSRKPFGTGFHSVRCKVQDDEPVARRRF